MDRADLTVGQRVRIIEGRTHVRTAEVTLIARVLVTLNAVYGDGRVSAHGEQYRIDTQRHNNHTWGDVPQFVTDEQYEQNKLAEKADTFLREHGLLDFRCDVSPQDRLKIAAFVRELGYEDK